MKMDMRDERLEELSDKVRMGFPIDFLDALEVIDYQEKLRKNKKITLWYKFLNLLSR